MQLAAFWACDIAFRFYRHCALVLGFVVKTHRRAFPVLILFLTHYVRVSFHVASGGMRQVDDFFRCEMRGGRIGDDVVDPFAEHDRNFDRGDGSI